MMNNRDEPNIEVLREKGKSRTEKHTRNKHNMNKQQGDTSIE
jgi:hypothetical protein